MFRIKHTVTRELGLALDAAIEEFTIEGVLDVPKHFDRWSNECIPLNDVSTYQLAKYIIEGYEYPKINEDSNKQQTIYVVQGRSGIVFSATSNYEEALRVKDCLNEIESDRAIMGHWVNNKHIFQE
ncbi:hypothetical protein ACWA2B_10330 [Paenibacillus sp. CMM36]